jgi:hypothetical protein
MPSYRTDLWKTRKEVIGTAISQGLKSLAVFNNDTKVKF